jgi:hypothetical protein
MADIHMLPTACIQPNADDLADGMTKACADSLLRSLPARQGNLRLLAELAFLHGLRAGLQMAAAAHGHDEE